MVINQQNLASMYIALDTAFNDAFKGALTFYERIAMIVSSNSRVNDYKFMLQFPMLREWIGDRVIRSLSAQNFTIENKDYEVTIEVDRNDIQDDNIGIYNPIIGELGRAAAQHPDKLMAALMTGAFSTACYDGQYFIDTDHPVGSGTKSNHGGGSSQPWLVLDTTRSIKPFIFQRRTTPTLTRMDKPDDENAFMRKKFRYGVDYRGAAGYGLWQLAYGSKDTLNSTNLRAAITAMKGFTNDEGEPLGITPNLLVVSPDNMFAARDILLSNIVLGDGTAGGAKSNTDMGILELLVVDWL
jgi:phage major head subunit gpT-like protein